jgi:hypothetical protein
VDYLNEFCYRFNRRFWETEFQIGYYGYMLIIDPFYSVEQDFCAEPFKLNPLSGKISIIKGTYVFQHNNPDFHSQP